MIGRKSLRYRYRETDVADYLASMQAEPKQVGSVFVINRRVVGLELFDAQRTCEKYFKKIASGMGSMPSPTTPACLLSTSEKEVVAFLDRVASSDEHRYASVGLGDDCRLSSKRLAGAALGFADDLVHLFAFDMGDMAKLKRSGRRDYGLRRSLPVLRSVPDEE